MKKIYIILIVLLLTPIIVFAKTPNEEETLNVIKNIKNVQVEENIKILNTTIDSNTITFEIEKDGIKENKKINYSFKDKELVFQGGTVLLDNKISINNNEYSFYLYAILESKSDIPYNELNYYNNSNIKRLIKTNPTVKEYKEPSNTFGITLKDNTIYYHYYLDGDYPVIEQREIYEDSEFINPETSSYSLLITIMFLSAITMTIYTAVSNPNKKGMK